jgi:hypothetical protein
MSSADRLAAGAGLTAGAAVVGVAGVLLHRTLRVTLEIRRYAADIATAAEALRGNTDVAAGLGQLHGTVRRLGAAVGTSTAAGGVG